MNTPGMWAAAIAAGLCVGHAVWACAKKSDGHGIYAAGAGVVAVIFFLASVQA